MSKTKPTLPVILGLTLCLLGLALCLLGLGLAPAWAEDQSDQPQGDRTDPQWMLFPRDDQSSTEKLIYDYIKACHGIKGAMYRSKTNQDDIWLAYSFAMKDVPKLRIIVDTASRRKDQDSGRVLEQRIKVMAFFTLPEAVKEGRKYHNALLDFHNDYMTRYWVPGRIRISRRGNIVLETNLNIPSPDTPMHPEMVWDQMGKMALSWKSYYKELKDRVPLEEQ